MQTKVWKLYQSLQTSAKPTAVTHLYILFISHLFCPQDPLAEGVGVHWPPKPLDPCPDLVPLSRNSKELDPVGFSALPGKIRHRPCPQTRLWRHQFEKPKVVKKKTHCYRCFSREFFYISVSLTSRCISVHCREKGLKSPMLPLLPTPNPLSCLDPSFRHC